MASTRYCTCRPTHCRRGDAIEGAHRRSLRRACGSATYTPSTHVGSSAASTCARPSRRRWSASRPSTTWRERASTTRAGATPNDVLPLATPEGARRARRTRHRRAHARRMRCRRATSPRRATWYVGIVGRAAHVDHGVRVRRREHERFALTCASVHGAGFRRYGSERNSASF